MLQAIPLSTEDLEFKSPIEWEERREGFFLENFYRTLKRALFDPLNFFENLRRNSSYGKPLAYACLVEILTAAVSSLFWGGLLAGFAMGGSGHLGVLGANFQIFKLFIGLLFLVVSLFGASFVYYLVAVLFGARSRFRTLFRMYSYTESVVIFRLIPVIGNVIAEVYRGVLLFFGFKAVYRFGTFRALACTIAPGVLLLILVAAGGFSLFHYLLKV
jgi:hypothetical protein